MRFKERHRLSSAHVISLLSLFVAMSGWAYAATVEKNSVTSASVKNNSLKGKDVKDDSLTNADVDESTLDGIQGPSGTQGPQGPPGPQGLQGPPGPSTGPAGGVLTGTYPNPGLGLGVVESTNLAANLADVLDANDIATQGVDELELSDDLGDTLDANDVASQGVDDDELSNDLGNTLDENDIATDAIGKLELDANVVGNIELASLTFKFAEISVPDGGTPSNGNMDTRHVNLLCDAGDVIVSGGASWNPMAAQDEELYIVESFPTTAHGWWARGGNDSGTARTLQVRALCLGP